MQKNRKNAKAEIINDAGIYSPHLKQIKIYLNLKD